MAMLATLDLPAFAALAPLERVSLALAHGTADVLGCGAGIEAT
jgi:hypothetical protein